MPIAGAVEAVKQLAEYYNVFICTSPHTDYENCVLEKYEWVDNHLGRGWVRKIILTKDKTPIRGRYLIDDKPEIKGILAPEWEQILYDQPYNRNIPKRRLNWQNWREVLVK
jgi:5'-nucleotidase